MSIRQHIGFSLLCFKFSAIANPINYHENPHTTLNVWEPADAAAKRAVPEPSAYPWASETDPVIKNEFKWLNWNVEDKDDERDGRKIHQAFREWHEFAKAGLQAAEKYQAKPPANILFKR